MTNIYWSDQIPIVKNRYFFIYNQLIDKTINRKISNGENYEIHHIIPYSFYKKSKRSNGFLNGNPNDKSNLVQLTVKEHYLAHRLLEKFTIGIAKNKMAHAITMMNIGHETTRYKIPSRVYEYIHQKYKIGFKAGHASRAGKLGGIKGGAYAKSNKTGIHNLPMVTCDFCHQSMKLNHFAKHTCNTINKDALIFFKENSHRLVPGKIRVIVNKNVCLSIKDIAREFNITVFQAHDLRKRFRYLNASST